MVNRLLDVKSRDVQGFAAYTRNSNLVRDKVMEMLFVG
jgi:hypothetical protein